MSNDASGTSPTESQPSGSYHQPSEPEQAPGQAPYGQTPYGQTPYGQAPYSQAPYGQAPYGQPSYGQPSYGQAPYGQPSYGQPSYGEPYGQQPYPSAPHLYAEPGYAPAGPGTDGFAIGALVSGILGVTFVPGLASIVALVLGVMSLGRIRATGQEGRGMAIVGIVLGTIGVALLLLAIIAFVLFFAALGHDWPAMASATTI